MASYVTLNNDTNIPVLGLGTYDLKGKKCIDTVKTAISLGYRLIDTAFIYENEAEVGEAINAKIEDGTVKREDLFVISKLWNTQHNPDQVELTIKQTLSDMKLSYLDLYLIHWPMASKPTENPYDLLGGLEDDIPNEDAWHALEKCLKAGYVKSIGVSNFNSVQLQRLLNSAEIKPVVNEVECNPYLNQEKLRKFCEDRNIKIISYTPLYKGYHDSKDVPRLLDELLLIELGEKYRKTVGQIVLRYLIDIGTIPIPKTESESRLKENLDVFDFKINAEDIKKINQLNKNLRAVPFAVKKDFKEYPFAIEF